MPRDMPSALQAAIDSGGIQPGIFLEAHFRSGPIYVWTGFGTIVWGGRSWIGIGSLGGISPIEEGSTVQARNVTLTLSGINPVFLTAVLSEFQTGAPSVIYFGLFAGNALLADPLVSWAGRMDKPIIDVSAETVSISIGCENRLVEMNTAVIRRYTNDDQQLDFPGDRGLEFVQGIQEVTIYFGATPNSTNNL